MSSRLSLTLVNRRRATTSEARRALVGSIAEPLRSGLVTTASLMVRLGADDAALPASVPYIRDSGAARGGDASRDAPAPSPDEDDAGAETATAMYTGQPVGQLLLPRRRRLYTNVQVAFLLDRGSVIAPSRHLRGGWPHQPVAFELICTSVLGTINL